MGQEKTINELERRVLEMLLAGDEPALATLREQARQATLAGREFTDSGFFTSLTVPADAPRLRRTASFEIGDLNAEISGVQCGFVLFVREGIIDSLEGHTWGEPQWPDQPQLGRMFYVRAGDDDQRLVEAAERDLDSLLDKITSM